MLCPLFYMRILEVEVYHNVGNIRLLCDQALIVHPVNIFLPALLGLREELRVLGLHERQQRLTGLLLYIRVECKVCLVLIVEQNLQNIVGIALEVLKALAASAQEALQLSELFAIISSLARKIPS